VILKNLSTQFLRKLFGHFSLTRFFPDISLILTQIPNISPLSVFQIIGHHGNGKTGSMSTRYRHVWELFFKNTLYERTNWMTDRSHFQITTTESINFSPSSYRFSTQQFLGNQPTAKVGHFQLSACSKTLLETHVRNCTIKTLRIHLFLKHAINHKIHWYMYWNKTNTLQNTQKNIPVMGR